MGRLTLAAGLCVAILAACIGAAFSRGGEAAPQEGTASGQEPVQEQKSTDKQKRLPLTAVRAPADVGDNAFAHVESIVAFGARYAGQPGWTQQLAYIERTLEQMGLQVKRDTWTDRKELITFTNLSATLPGKRKERILLCCHHDTKCTKGHTDPEHNFDFVGANDGGSGVGLLLALAPVLAAQEREATIELVFFDGEESLDWRWNDGERALFGSKRFVKRHRDAALLGEEPRIAAVILLDMVGRTDLHLQDELFSTPELRTVLWSAAVATGHDKHVFQRVEGARDDHMPFLEVGIPAVNLIDLNGNPFWHTKLDIVANMSPKSLQITADLVLTMLPEVERSYVLHKN